MLFTGKGDDGTTSFYGSPCRFAKHEPLAEALGTVDELNSLLGVVRSRVAAHPLFEVGGAAAADVVLAIQHDLFTVQAILADTERKLTVRLAHERLMWLEELTREIESRLPPLKHFSVPGATEESALFDYARAVARRAERRVVALEDAGRLGKDTVAYMNRLSSLLFALARLATKSAGKEETRPRYGA